MKKSEFQKLLERGDVEMVPYPDRPDLFFAMHPSRQSRKGFEAGFLTITDKRGAAHVKKRLSEYLATPACGSVVHMDGNELLSMSQHARSVFENRIDTFVRLFGVGEKSL
jgi:hypothetical protein